MILIFLLNYKTIDNVERKTNLERHVTLAIVWLQLKPLCSLKVFKNTHWAINLHSTAKRIGYLEKAITRVLSGQVNFKNGGHEQCKYRHPDSTDFLDGFTKIKPSTLGSSNQFNYITFQARTNKTKISSLNQVTTRWPIFLWNPINQKIKISTSLKTEQKKIEWRNEFGFCLTLDINYQ